MSCPKCSADKETNYRFCPFCGDLLDKKNDLPPSSDLSPSPSLEKTALKKRMPLWFKLTSLLAVLSLIGVTAGILFTESWVDVIDHQLEALRRQDIAKSYEAYTSKDFQIASPFDHYRNFIEAYPVFLNNQSAHFSQRTIEHHIGILKGNLTDVDHINTPIEYKLIKEGGKWKILSIRLLKPENIPNAKEANQKEDLIDVVKGQLKDIQDQKLSHVYQHFSSKEFKEATSEEGFYQFLQRYPLLSHFHAASFHNPTIRNGVGSLSVILQSDKTDAYIKYYLIFEDRQWKVWSMRILSPQKNQKLIKSKSSSTKFEKKPLIFDNMTLGNSVDEHGVIIHSATSFKKELGDLYVDLEVQNGIKGDLIYLNLKHLQNGNSVPAKVSIEKEGSSMVMSVFTPPPKGWESGKYQLTASAKSGVTISVDFEIE